MDKKIRVIVAKSGLDGHDRGAKVIAAALRDAGMEVIYTGLRQTPEMIVEAAVQEDADVIGVSSLGGAHLQLGRELISEAEKEGIKDNKAYIIGGAIPPEDALKLKEMGFDAIFASGATKEEIVSSIRAIFEKKSK